MFSWGWVCVGEKACLRCVKLDVKSIRGKRTCTKTASVLTFFALRAETGDRSCWIIVILNRSSLRSFRFGIIVTTFSMVWHTALRYDNTRSRRLHTFYESVCVEIATPAGTMNEQRLIRHILTKFYFWHENKTFVQYR